MISDIVHAWNPNKYAALHERSLPRVLLTVVVGALLATAIFLLLLTPTLLTFDETIADAAQTTSVHIQATMEQSEPAYIARNPDIVLAMEPVDAFISITPEAFTIKRFIFFGPVAYSWDGLSNLSTMPAAAAMPTLVLFLFPSVVVWGSAWLLFILLGCALLFSFIAHFVVHARGSKVSYNSICKVAAYATLPSIMLFAVIPILRLGLPISMLAGLMLVLWLLLALLGTTMISEGHRHKN